MTHDADITFDALGGGEPPASIPPGLRRTRDLEETYRRMAHLQCIAAEELGLAGTPSAAPRRGRGDGTDGLLLRSLVEDRWKVAPQTATAKLKAAALPVAGRRQKIVYSWASIFLAEGVPPDIAKIATRRTHPQLFDDLLTPSEAATLIGVQSDATIRKLVLSGKIAADTCITFGARGIRRFRPALLEAQRLERLEGRLV